jgi:hypothetical protein
MAKPLAALLELGQGPILGARGKTGAVSYTHLTLPTN